MIRKLSLFILVCMLLLPALVVGQDANNPNLSAYYGFGDLDIIKLDWNMKCLKTADFNKDGKTDFAVVNNKDSKIEILLQKSDVAATDSGNPDSDSNDIDINEINAPTRYQKSPVPVSVKIANFACSDLNGDGSTDLAFYAEPAALYIMLQEPSESTAKSLAWKPVKKIKIDDALLSPNTLESADMNNDKRYDLVLAAADSVYVITQKEDGSLAEPVKYPTTSRALALRVCDLNGDRRADLTMITDDGEKPFHVRFGLPNGQLGPQMQFKIEVPSSVEFVDYDNSGAEKLLTVDSKSGRLVAYKYLSDKGTGDDEWPILFYPLPAGKESTGRDLIVADIDGDGLSDVLVTDPTAAQFLFYKQVKSLGLDEPKKFPAFANITCMCAVDIDNDHQEEIGVLSVKEKAIGISRFEKGRITFPTPIKTVGEPQAMQLVDVDSDRKCDCVYISRDSNDVRWLRIVSNIRDSKAAESAKPLELKGLSANPDGIVVFDADNDSLADVLVLVNYDQPIFVRQAKKGIFEIVDSGQSQGSLIKDAKLGTVSVVDLDTAKGPELLIAEQNFARSLRFADGKWQILDQYNAKSTDNQITGAAAFDVDGDKIPEILLLDGQKGQLQVLKAGEDKTYRFEKEVETNTWNIKRMLFAPLTGKKTPSVVLFDSDKFALITPDSTIGRMQQTFTYETTIKEGRYAAATAGDINADGITDIIAVEYKKNHIEILGLDQNFQPVAATRFKVFEQKSYRDDQRRAGGHVEPSEIAIADVTGDGKNDMVTLIHDRIIVYPQD